MITTILLLILAICIGVMHMRPYGRAASICHWVAIVVIVAISIGVEIPGGWE
jgi:hypothetical protein